MLVLSRKKQERILIGKDITLTVIRIKGNVVRIGVEAPKNVRVRRVELEPLGQTDPESVGCRLDVVSDVPNSPEGSINESGNDGAGGAETVSGEPTETRPESD